MYLGLPARRVCGGATSYVAPEEGGQQPDTYNVPGLPARRVCGGATSYVAPEEGPSGEGSGEGAGAALVTVPPVSNALSLVYCDAGAAGFTKYVSRMTMPEGDCFYMLTCTYKE
ncbi:hypothetical protein MSG28_009076 [Choristoneura fumiferana]|uniref:Uncharacterized protein n=1 Tax=Choristoneura fumiferana TaxID=7141 RepID=A0ACC0KW81_CHOFU|nr:hypothetical protein MSG28_009076 [Choristoneura fumiferana]